MFKLYYFIGIAISFLVFSLFDSSFNNELLEIILLINFISIFIFLIRKEENKGLQKQYFRHSYFFLVGFIIVYFQLPLDIIFAGESPYDGELYVSSSLIIPNAVYSAIGLHFFLVGYELYILKSKAKGVFVLRQSENKYNVVNCKLLNYLTLISFIGYIGTINPMYLTGHYGSVDIGSTAGYFIVAFKLVFTASILQQGFNLRSLDIDITSFKSFLKQLNKIPLIVLGCYLFTVLISGDRGPLIYYSLLIVVVYFYVSKQKIRFTYLFGLAFIGAIAITLLGIVRNVDFEGSFLEKVEYAYDVKKESTSISQNTRELARSYRILSLGIQDIPYKYDYTYGKYQFKMLLITVPGLYNLVDSVIDDPEFSDFLTTSEVYTWLYFGDFPRYGLGTSSLGDLYVDFGLLGICMGMLLFGFFMRYGEEILYVKNSVSMFALIFSVVYLCSVMYISRDMLLFDLAIVVKVYLIININKILIKK